MESKNWLSVSTGWLSDKMVAREHASKSVCNRGANERFGGVFVLSLCPFDISVGVGAFVIGLSQISSSFSLKRINTILRHVIIYHFTSCEILAKFELNWINNNLIWTQYENLLIFLSDHWYIHVEEFKVTDEFLKYPDLELYTGLAGLVLQVITARLYIHEVIIQCS